MRRPCLPNASRLSSTLLYVAAALALAACAEGAPSTNELDDLLDAVGDATGDLADGDAADVPVGSGTLELCVLGDGGPQGTCLDPEVLDFGMLSAGASIQRLFRVDNETGAEITASQLTFDTPTAAMGLKAVRYDAVPGSPGSLMRSAVMLPATIAAGDSLWVEVTVTPGGQAGPLPAGKAIVLFMGGPPDASRVEVPIVGELSGCMLGLGDCDGDPSNGCETDLLMNDMHCGSCGSGCNPTAGSGMCVGGVCTITSCDADRGDCDDEPRNGCEVDLTRTNQHCGACGSACTNPNGTTMCVASLCTPTCSGGFGDCDSMPENGCEAELNTLEHCGGCNLVCNPTNASGDCSAGTCAVAQCNSGWADCDGDPTNGCEIDTNNELAHCGGCNVLCSTSNGTNACVDGACAPTCDAGFGDCDGDGTNGCEAALDTNPSCSAGVVDMGAIRGDNGADVRSHTGFGETRLRIKINEDSSGFCSSDDLCARFNLDVPPGTDYDLLAFCDNCDGADASSVNAGETDEVTHVRWDENTFAGCPTGSDSGRTIQLHVVFKSGNTCAPWTLTATGNQCTGGNTCGDK